MLGVTVTFLIQLEIRSSQDDGADTAGITAVSIKPCRDVLWLTLPVALKLYLAAVDPSKQLFLLKCTSDLGGLYPTL